jgi:N-acetylneuraminate synthase
MNHIYEIAGRKIGFDFPPLVIISGINHEFFGCRQSGESPAHRAGVEVLKPNTLSMMEVVGAAKEMNSGNAVVSIYMNYGTLFLK